MKNDSNTENKTVATTEEDRRGYVSNEMADLTCVINLIMDYYGATAEHLEPNEEWKKDSEDFLPQVQVEVDKEVDESIKLAFLKHLKSHH